MGDETGAGVVPVGVAGVVGAGVLAAVEELASAFLGRGAIFNITKGARNSNFASR